MARSTLSCESQAASQATHSHLFAATVLTAMTTPGYSCHDANPYAWINPSAVVVDAKALYQFAGSRNCATSTAVWTCYYVKFDVHKRCPRRGLPRAPFRVPALRLRLHHELPDLHVDDGGPNHALSSALQPTVLDPHVLADLPNHSLKVYL